MISVSTTTTKQPSVLKTEIRKVLDRMQVQYRETRSGFECIHAPSIDLSSVQPETNSRRSNQGQQQSSTIQDATGAVRRSLTKKASKLSFALKGKGKDGEPTPEPEPSPRNDSFKESGTLNSGGATIVTRSASDGSSLYNGSSAASTVKPDLLHANDATSNLADSSKTSKNLPPIPRDFAPPPRTASPQPATLPTGEVDQDVFDAIGSGVLSVRFEINIVKVSNHYKLSDDVSQRTIYCRFRGYLFTVSNSEELEGMDGNIKC